jgi:hypothetical protein
VGQRVSSEFGVRGGGEGAGTRAKVLRHAQLRWHVGRCSIAIRRDKPAAAQQCCAVWQALGIRIVAHGAGMHQLTSKECLGVYELTLAGGAAYRRRV